MNPCHRLPWLCWQASEEAAGWAWATFEHATLSALNNELLAHPRFTHRAARRRSPARQGQHPLLLFTIVTHLLLVTWCLFFAPLCKSSKEPPAALFLNADSWISSQTLWCKYMETEARESVFLFSPLSWFWCQAPEHCNHTFVWPCLRLRHYEQKIKSQSNSTPGLRPWSLHWSRLLFSAQDYWYP